MAHLVETIAYAGDVPWHGLGAKVSRGSSIDEWIEQSGLIWSAEMADVAVRSGPINGDGKNSWQPAANYKAVYRSDTGEIFHIASNRYKPVQPKQILEFFRDLSESHRMEIETCGALKGGAIVWALATNDDKIVVAGSDVIKPYLLLSTSYDGSQATRGCFTSVRVVCNNTLRLSYGSDKEGVVNVRHNTVFDEQAVKANLGLLEQQTEQFAAMAQKLASTQVSPQQVESLWRNWFGQKKDKDDDRPITDPAVELTTHSRNVIEMVKQNTLSAPGQQMASTQGTAWGVLNGVTRTIDFTARAHNDDNRLCSAWFGKGDQLKGQAVRELVALAA